MCPPAPRAWNLSGHACRQPTNCATIRSYTGLPNVEIEFKLGRIIDTSSDTRLCWPVRTPVLLEDGVDSQVASRSPWCSHVLGSAGGLVYKGAPQKRKMYRFESTVSEHAFKVRRACCVPRPHRKPDS